MLCGVFDMGCGCLGGVNSVEAAATVEDHHGGDGGGRGGEKRGLVEAE